MIQQIDVTFLPNSVRLLDRLDADLVPKDKKNRSIFQKALGIDYDYLVKFIVDEPHLGL